ncbi:MAG: response regulator transcription factor [Firmicutes bacterium]|jgi:DNA-binding LytR/AlgR family response regulator|nr:response regulator transcription factor [Bacillota bacterium]
MRVCILDDEKNMAEELKSLCKTYFAGKGLEVQVTGLQSFPKGWLDGVEPLPDLLLLDIEMPELDGITIKEKLEKVAHKSYIIFVSSHDELMGETYGRNVLGFLKKPVDEEKLYRLLGKAVDFYQEQFLTVPLDYGETIDCRNIICIRVSLIRKNQVDIICTDGVIPFRRTLKEWEELLPMDDFFRTGSNSIVHLAFVERQEGETILLKNGERLKLSRQKKVEFQRARLNYARRKGRVL